MSRTRKIKFLFLMLITGSFTVLVTATEAGESGVMSNTFEFRPGVIIDPDNSGVMYVMNTENGIEAIDMSSGNRVWLTQLAQKPLLRHKSLLIAQGQAPERHNILQIVGFDSTEPDKAVFMTDITLPADVQASIADSMESTFRISASISEGNLVLHWNYMRHAISGIDHDAEGKITDIRKNGTVEVNLENMRAVHFPRDKWPGQSGATLPEVVSTKLAEKKIPGPVLYGEKVIAVVQRKSAKQGVTLYRWDVTGRSLPELALFGHGVTYRYASANGRHLLASKLSDSTESAQGKYLWSIRSVDTGKKIAEFHNDRVGAWFFVWGALLIHEVLPSSQLIEGKWIHEPLGLRAVNTRTGAPVWFASIRDLTYRGEFPPEMLQGPGQDDVRSKSN